MNYSGQVTALCQSINIVSVCPSYNAEGEDRYQGAQSVLDSVLNNGTVCLFGNG